MMRNKFWDFGAFTRIGLLVILLLCISFNVFMGCFHKNMMSLLVALPIVMVAFIINLRDFIIDYKLFNEIKRIEERILKNSD